MALRIPTALHTHRVIDPTAPWGAGQIQQLQPAESTWMLSAAQADPLLLAMVVPNQQTGAAFLTSSLASPLPRLLSSRAGQRPASNQVSHEIKAWSWQLRLPHLSPGLSHAV